MCFENGKKKTTKSGLLEVEKRKNKKVKKCPSKKDVKKCGKKSKT